MRIFHRFTNPKDRRWQGKQKCGPILMIPITVLVAIIWILFIVAMIYSRVFYDSHPRSYYEEGNRWNEPAPPIAWDSADENAYKFFFRAFALIPELFHLPIHMSCYITGRMHPVAALTLSIIFSILWTFAAVWSWILDIIIHQNIPTAYMGLSYTEFGFGLIVALLYLVYMGYAARAVHVWRRGRRESIKLVDEVELQEGLRRKGQDK